MKNINDYVKEAKAQNIPLIDVRPASVYEQGHIPSSINIPLSQMETAQIKPGSYLYCGSGYQASLAKEALAHRGIEAINIGGIQSYEGKVEKS